MTAIAAAAARPLNKPSTKNAKPPLGLATSSAIQTTTIFWSIPSPSTTIRPSHQPSLHLFEHHLSTSRTKHVFVAPPLRKFVRNVLKKPTLKETRLRPESEATYLLTLPLFRISKHLVHSWLITLSTMGTSTGPYHRSKLRMQNTQMRPLVHQLSHSTSVNLYSLARQRH